MHTTTKKTISFRAAYEASQCRRRRERTTIIPSQIKAWSEFDAPAQALIARLTRADAGRTQASILALDELVATMRFGLDALLAAHGTSADPRPAAHCLWREYQRGRAATLREAALATRG